MNYKFEDDKREDNVRPLSVLHEVAPSQFEERHGMLYDDFILNDTYSHRPGRTITESDNTWLSLLSMNQHPLHIDQEYANATEFGQTDVSSLVTFAIVGGLSLRSTSMRGVANLGWKNVSLPNPVFVGDTIYAKSCVTAKRHSRSRPLEGIITVKTLGCNQKREIVLTWERSFLVPLGSVWGVQ